MSKTRKTIISALCFLLPSCALDDPDLAGREHGITGGSADSSRPAVCALVYPSTSQYAGQIFCSATLISHDPPRVLSAAHCMFEADGSQSLPSQLDVAFGPQEGAWVLVAPVASVTVHPDYKWTGQKPSDIAFVDLDLDALSTEEQAVLFGIVPIPANSESIDGRQGESWLFMGYGADNQHWNKIPGKGKYSWTGYGIKRSVQIPIARVNPSDIPSGPYDQSIMFGTFDYYAYFGENVDPNDPANQAANTCYGDSGGPALANIVVDGHEIEVVTGVTSGGDSDCGADGSWGFDTRVDTFYPFVTGPATTTNECKLRHSGDSCESGSDCCSGKCAGKPGFRVCKGG